MSKSLFDLLANISADNVQIPPTEGEIYNPDIPTVKVPSTSTRKLRDQYYNDMKQSSQPRNGTGYSFDKMKGQLPNTNPKDDAFMVDGAIDPNKIRKRTDPVHSLPDSFDNGTLYDKFQLPQSTYEEVDSHGLLLKASNSFNNYKNRFNLDPSLQVIQNLIKS